MVAEITVIVPRQVHTLNENLLAIERETIRNLRARRKQAQANQAKRKNHQPITNEFWKRSLHNIIGFVETLGDHPPAAIPPMEGIADADVLESPEFKGTTVTINRVPATEPGEKFLDQFVGRSARKRAFPMTLTVRFKKARIMLHWATRIGAIID